MKRAVMFTCVAVSILAIAFLISIPLVNDYMAAVIKESLVEIPLPEKTEYLESVSKAGKLTGNGNGMQYFGGILIKSELSMDELNNYYATYRENEWEFIVEKQEGQKIEAIEHGTLLFQTEISAEDTYYIVCSWGSSDEFFATLDIRGH